MQKLSKLLSVFISTIMLTAFSQSISFAGQNTGIANQTYGSKQLINEGHKFFEKASSSLAGAIEFAIKKFGKPNAYIVGEQAGGAFIFGLTYGEGYLHFTAANGQNYSEKIFWQGPSLGFDIGAQGSRLMILVYNLEDVGDIWGRYVGVEGSAYILAGFSIKALNKDHIRLVPISTGIGGRLGVNVGYLKLTPAPTWNPL